MNKNLSELKNHDHFNGLVEVRKNFKPETEEEKELLEEINWAIVTMVRQAKQLDKLEKESLYRKSRAKTATHLTVVK